MDTKQLTEEQIYAIACDGMLNAAGGIYGTRVVEFAHGIEEAVRAALAPSDAAGTPTVPRAVLDALRFYARGHHYTSTRTNSSSTP